MTPHPRGLGYERTDWSEPGAQITPLPEPLCPNCLEPAGIRAPSGSFRHWVEVKPEEGYWTCTAASDEELEAAGYLLRLEVPDEGPV